MSYAGSPTGAPPSGKGRPDPVVSIDSKFFWDGAERGELLTQQCGSCKSYWHPPRPMCPNCYSLDQRKVPLSGEGTVYSWILPVHPAPIGFDEPPIVALIDLKEGMRIVSNVRGVDPKDMKNGMAVKVAFEQTRGGKAVPVFHPVEK